MEVKNIIEKQQPIVALGHSTKPKKARPPRNNLLLSLKKNDLELNFYVKSSTISCLALFFCLNFNLSKF